MQHTFMGPNPFALCAGKAVRWAALQLTARAVLLGGALLLPAAASAQASPACCAPTAADSPKVGGNYGNTGYSSLSRIDRKTVGGLGAAWHLRAEGGDDRAFQQGNAVALSGVVYVETTQGSVLAVDGATGAVRWRYKPDYGQTLRRGVALGEGKVFTLTAGNRAVALDQATGKPVWEKTFTADRTMGTMPTAVTYYDGKIFFGTANSSRGVGFALRASDGEEVWRFYGAPSAGEFGSDSWAGESWKSGGAAPWQHPAVDPQLGLIYWTFGNARAGGPLDGSDARGREPLRQLHRRHRSEDRQARLAFPSPSITTSGTWTMSWPRSCWT